MRRLGWAWRNDPWGQLGLGHMPVGDLQVLRRNGCDRWITAPRTPFAATDHWWPSTTFWHEPGVQEAVDTPQSSMTPTGEPDINEGAAGFHDISEHAPR